MQNSLNSTSEYVPTGTDIAEFEQWKANLGNPSNNGVGEITPDDYADAGFEPTGV
jgi:hypothetical protein